jgi:hypothetical protein
MRAGHWCRCCGLGIAFRNFSGSHAHWNFFSAHVALDTQTDEQGWVVGTLPQNFLKAPGFVEQTPWRSGFIGVGGPLSLAPRLLRFAYKIDEDAEVVRIQITMQMRYVRTPFFFADWQWALEYELPFVDYERLMTEGRLRINDYQVSATHSGNTGVTLEATTNTQDGWGDIVLVWPPFTADWTDKKLVVEADTATPFKETTLPVGFGYGVPINLSWLLTPHEFVFDDTTYVENLSNVVGVRERWYEDSHTDTECYSYFTARHYSIVDEPWPFFGQDSIAAPDRYLLDLSFRTPSTCNGSDVAPDVCMDWQISGIWWKAFEDNGVVVATEYKNPLTVRQDITLFQVAAATPVLYTRWTLTSNPTRQGLMEFDQEDQAATVFPITYTLSLLPIV